MEGLGGTMTEQPPDETATDVSAPSEGSARPESFARRPLVERLGMAAVALVLAIMFGGMAVASWIGGEGFLAIMAGIGALMTAWAGVRTVLRG